MILPPRFRQCTKDARQVKVAVSEPTFSIFFTAPEEVLKWGSKVTPAQIFART